MNHHLHYKGIFKFKQRKDLNYGKIKPGDVNENHWYYL